MNMGMKVSSVSTGGVILCGGLSTRMGTSKALLPFGPETMLQRVVRMLSTVVWPIVVVAAAGQSLPDLPAGVVVTRDEQPDRGPLEGLRAGLKALPETIESAYVTSCDVPLLVPDFARRMIDLLADHDIAVMEIDGSLIRCLRSIDGARCLMSKHCWRRIACGPCFSSTRSEPAAWRRRRCGPPIRSC